MSATFEQLEQRVAYLERELRRTTAIIDQLDARTDIRLAAIDRHLDKQDVTQQEFAAQVNQRFEHQDTTVNERFEHVYGQLADINANTVEIRNILADLVKKVK